MKNPPSVSGPAPSDSAPFGGGVADDAKKTGQTVMRLRDIVVMVLVVSTTAVAFGINFYFRQFEESHFRDAFYNDATKLQESILGGITQTLMCMDTLSVAVVSYADSSNSTWPFVTVPHFAIHGTKFLKLAPVLYFQFIVNVADEDRIAWEAYSHENNGWIADAMQMQQADDTFVGVTPSEFVKPERISSSFEDSPTSERGYMVTWQNVPHTAVYAPYNWDHYSPLDARGIETMVETKKSILTNTWQLPNMANEEEVKQFEIWATNWYA